MTDLDVVVFDLDDTLCVPNRSSREIHDEICAAADVDPNFTVDDVRDVEIAALPTADTDREFYANMYRAVAENVGGDPGYAEHLAEVTLAVLDPTDVSARDGAIEAVEYARDRYEVAVVTNGSADTQFHKLEAIGLDGAFETVVCCDPANGVDPKPDPTPLHTALDAVGVEPARAINVGDHHEFDVVGAHNAGMDSAWVPTEEFEAIPTPEPTYHLDSMEDLTRVL